MSDSCCKTCLVYHIFEAAALPFAEKHGKIKKICAFGGRTCLDPEKHVNNGAGAPSFNERTNLREKLQAPALALM